MLKLDTKSRNQVNGKMVDQETGLKQKMNFIILIVHTTNFFHQKSGKKKKKIIYKMYYVLTAQILFLY